MRPNRHEMFMQVAHVVKQRSTCKRLQVGCVITNLEGTSIVSMGYNGNARGLPDTCDSSEPGACGCLHAEENALLKAPYGKALVLYSTTTPCLMCAKRIINSSVNKIYFDEPYRKTDGVELLLKVGINVEQLKGLHPWEQEIKNFTEKLVISRHELKTAYTVINCLMADLNPGWRPGENAAARAWYEEAIQRVVDSKVRIGPGPVPLSIMVEVQ